jgi:hypothetical protein
MKAGAWVLDLPFFAKPARMSRFLVMDHTLLALLFQPSDAVLIVL